MKKTLSAILAMVLGGGAVAGQPVTDEINVAGEPKRIPQGAGEFAIERPRSTGGATVKAADFGFSATNDCNAAAIMRALDHCRATGASRLELAPGTYRCFDPDHGLTVADLEDFTLDGKGALLVFRRPTRRLSANSVRIPGDSDLLVTNCVRCVVRNFKTDWDWATDPLCDVGVVIGTHVDAADNASYFDLEFPDWPDGHPKYGRPLPIQTMTPINAARDRLTGESPNRLLFGLTEGHFGSKMAWLARNRIRVWPGVHDPTQYSAPINEYYYGPDINRRTAQSIQKGVNYRCFHYYYGKNGITLHSGRHVTLEDIDVISCFGMPIVVAGATEYCEFLRVNSEPKKGRPCAGTSDGCHIARSKGHVKFTACRMALQNDDGFNWHDCFTLGVPAGSRRIRVTNVRGPAYLGAETGDVLELRRWDFRPLGWTGRLVATEGDTLVVDRDLPPLEGEHFLVYDTSYCSDYIHMKDCVYHDTHLRELVQPSHVTIENCRFVRTGNGFKFVSAHSREFWCEGKGTRDVVVRGCVFEHTNFAADWRKGDAPEFETAVRFPRPKPYPPGNDVFTAKLPPGFDLGFHGDILIENCRFVDPLGSLFRGDPVRNLIFRNNVIELTGARPPREMTGSFRFGAAEEVFITGNRYRLAPALREKVAPQVFGTVPGLVLRDNRLETVADDHRPETWFHLIGGNVSKAGLTADLEAIKAAGIGGIQLFHGQIGKNQTWPGVTNPIPCLSANWDGMVAHAAAECRRLGLTFKLQNCPGWSMSGGPWIRPENAMRNLCCSETCVETGATVKLPVAELATDGPDRDYRDLFVLAFPTPKGDGEGWLAPKEVLSPSAQSRVFVFDRPVTVRTLDLPPTSELDHSRTYDPETTAVFEAETAPGVWRTVVREALPPGNWQDNRKCGARYTLACDEATAKTWRLTLASADPLRLGVVRLSSAARLEHWEGLAGWTVRGLVDRPAPKQDPRCWVDPQALVDLTGRMRPDGALDWSPTDGRRWTVLRIGHVNGGFRNGPAPAEATGWECSKLSPRGIEANYAAYVGRLAKGPLKGRLDGLVVDSWECYRDNWMDGLDATFAARCGYGLVRWLPSVFGRVIGSPAETERFLRDWRGLLGKLVEENYYRRLAELAHADGLAVQYETSFGDALAGDLLEFWKYADVPMCEFWRPSAPTGVGSHDFKPVKPCVSAAHVYGFRRVAAEALTNCALTWDEKPSDFKTVIDRHYARGVTHLVFHTYTHNPQVGFKKPGTSFGGFIGTPFVRGQDWWRHMPAFTDYAARCGEFLEAGKPVVDVLRVLGDGLGHKPSERSESFGNRFKEDYVNKDVLTTRLAVRNGRLVLPDGMEYAVLWVPEGTYLDAESARRIGELERQGAKVVRTGDPTEGLTADVVSPDGKLLWYHRRANGEDRYFVAACDADSAGDVTFRGRRVRLDLAKGESRFVTFGARGVTVVDPVTGREAGGCNAKLAGRTLARCAGETEWRGQVTAKGGERAWLDLGKVYGVAEVFVNGRSAATCWCPPWRCELTDWLTVGTNDVRVTVATTWYNRLRVDQAKREVDRAFWTISPPKPDAPAKPEGLHGDVRLLTDLR